MRMRMERKDSEYVFRPLRKQPTVKKYKLWINGDVKKMTAEEGLLYHI